MKCPSCRAEVLELGKFCNHCGAVLAHCCPSCGNGNPPGSNFCSECGTGLTRTSAPQSSVDLRARTGLSVSAERRHLTVMFCDLVGSTALSTHLDVEDLRELIRSYQKSVADAVGRFGGFVARRVGDGALIYFGYPHAQEDDPEQAVRAGLAILKAIDQLNGPEPIKVRVGIATGLVVVGDLVGSGATHELEVLGEGPNLAARLLALAEPNTIMVADATRRLLGSMFELEDLGTSDLKGFDEPQRIWRVLGENRIGRFEALRGTEAPLIGRDEEMELLDRRWQQVKDGEGRVVLISGEPGIGKSRLAMTLRDSLRADAHVCWRCFCSPHHQNSALFPIIVQIERAADFRREDTPEVKLSKLEALLAMVSLPDQDAALLADLLMLPRGRYPKLDFLPQQRKQKIFEALLRQLNRIAGQTPMLVTFEDLQWIDATSLELLHHLIERMERLPVLLIGTFRPEFRPPWAGQSHVTNLTLNRMSRREAACLVQQLAEPALSKQLVEQIVERSDGVPLFVEEMTKFILEAGISADRMSAVLTPEMTSVPPALQVDRMRAVLTPERTSVPPALQASLLARLDRLGAVAKEVSQIGATIGREFSYELLAFVAQRPDSELHETLGQLVRAGVVSQRGELPRSDFLFKHALVQEAAYSTLLREPRQKLHARIAQALEEMFCDVAASRPELVARHLSEAALGERAVVYWQRAGELALRRSALTESVSHLSTAMRIVEGLPESARQELEIRLGLGTALIVARGSSLPEVATHYGRAVTLSRTLGDDKQLFRALWGSWYTSLTTGHTERALPLANELVDVAGRLGDNDLTLEAYHSRWATSHVSGFLAETLTDTERGTALYNPARHHGHAYEYGGHDTGVCARAHSAVTLWITGFPEKATRMSAAALELGRRLEHPPSLAHAAWWSATLRQFLREPEACRELAELTIRIAHEQGSTILVMCPLLVGWALFESGQASEGLQRMQQAVTTKRQRGHRYYYEYELLVYAETLLRAGQVHHASDIADEALAFIKTSRTWLFEAEANRVKGACLAALGGGHAIEGETFLLKAIETAERQGALSFTLRAAIALARAWCAQGQRLKARDLLENVHGRFTEGLQTPDLQDAAILLNDLACPIGPPDPST
jgi:class 3 adenylate cyclase/predicted ATPase